MAPSLTQLAALVPLDPTTLVLLTFALLPARWTPRVVAPALRHPWWLRWPVVALALVSLALPVLPWPVIALLNAYLFLEAFTVATGSSAPWRRWTALAAVAGYWSFQTFRTFWQTFFEPDGQAHFWFVDLFNKLYLALVDPLLLQVGGPEARGAVLAYLAEPMAFFSNHLLAMHLLASLGAAVLLTHVLTGRINLTSDAQLEGPAALTARLPARVTALAAAAVLAHALAPGQWALTILREVGGAALVWQGLTFGLRLTVSSRTARAALVAAVVAMCLHPELVWLVGVLGAADSVFDLSGRDPSRLDAISREGAAVVRAVRRGFGPAILLLTAVPLVSFPLVPLSYMVQADPTWSRADGPKEDPGTPTIPVGAGIVIDRHEHPNRPGELPTTGLSPREADARCQAEGKVLCDSVDWYRACSDDGERFYVVRSYPYQASALSRIRRECNLQTDDRPAALSPSGTMSRCRSADGVEDMVGNAYEWVRLVGLDGFWGLAGSYYRYSDAQTPSCGFRVLVHESQLGVIDLDATGARCCAQRGT